MTSETEQIYSRDYKAHLGCARHDGWHSEALAQVARWLREREFDVGLDQSGDYSHADAQLRVRRAQSAASDSLKMTLRETGPTGTWTTELLTHADSTSDGWINLKVSSADGKFVAVPRLARYLMKVLPLGDGSMEFTDGQRWMGIGDIDRLIDLLVDPDRHCLVFVAGTEAESAIPVDAFANKVGEWARQVYGLAEVIVLDPAATEEFRRRVGTRFGAREWTIRTYQPGVRFEDWADGRRHRILSTNALGNRSNTGIQRLLGDVARTQAATRPDDPTVINVRRRFERQENQRLVESVTLTSDAPAALIDESTLVAPRDASDAVADSVVASPQESTEISLVKRIFGLARVTEQALRDIFARASRPEIDRRALEALERRVDDLQDAIERVQDKNRDLQMALTDTQLEIDMYRIDVDAKDSRINWLLRRLHERGDYEASYLDVPDEFLTAYPANFEELLDRLNQLSSVQFTGIPDAVEKLNQIDTNDAALRTAWDAVLALDDYVKARANGHCDNGIDHYLRHTPNGYRTFPIGKFATTETAATMQGYGAQRIFKVPTDVHTDGEVAMKAHFKLARIGMVSPRMHIYDGHPTVPKIFIGYIGTHLDNTQTN